MYNCGRYLAARKRFLKLYCLTKKRRLNRSFLEMGKVRLEVAPLIKIKIIPYKVWQVLSFLISRANKEDRCYLYRFKSGI